jgi:hypothetical protein
LESEVSRKDQEMEGKDKAIIELTLALDVRYFKFQITANLEST